MKIPQIPNRDRLYEGIICPFSAIIMSLLLIKEIEEGNVPSTKIMITFICISALFLGYSFIQRGELKPEEKGFIYYMNFVCSWLLTICTAILFFQNYLP